MLARAGLTTSMPGKYLFETNISMQCLRDRAFALRYASAYRQHLPTTFFSRVVAQELLVGCPDELAVRRVRNFFRPFERIQRTITPTYEDWKKAGLTAVTIVLRRPDLKDKKIALLNDILIALSCHRIGATLMTFSAQDFVVIREFLQFRFGEPLR
jgi:predicted nucleic acid-binding protein